MCAVILFGGGSLALKAVNLLQENHFSVFGYVAPEETRLSDKLKFLGCNDAEIYRLHKTENKFLNCVGFYNKKSRNTFLSVDSVLIDTARLSSPLISKSASVHESSSIGLGSIICAGAIVGENTKIAENCLVNSGAIIEHDCKIDRGCHISVGAIICGNVKIGQFSLVGAGAIVINNICLDPDSLIGAGEVMKS
ncbi:hypothetical protein ACMAY7_14110 [Rhodobacteraceae bacterium nBUS_24]